MESRQQNLAPQPEGPARNLGPQKPSRRFAGWLLALALTVDLLPRAHAALQFDVFLGYGGQPTGADGIVREAGWFPVACEVLNDGPTFNAVFEVSSTYMGGGQSKRLAVELPTNTRKRFIVPMFAASAGYSTWEAHLLDERGKVRAEKTGLRPRGVSWESILMGAVPRTFGGLPKLPELRGNNARTQLQPLVARLPVEQLADNPIALEGLDAVYLNSEKALEVKVDQAAALLSWVHGGGHLIIGVEQPGDLNATPWLKPLLPIELTDVVTKKPGRDVLDWLRSVSDKTPETAADTPTRPSTRVRPMGSGGRSVNTGFNPYADLSDDAEFNQADFAAATGKLRDGQVLLSVQGTPLIVTGHRGRGRVTVLTFSPEREPFRSWKNREWFWAKVLRVPMSWYGAEYMNAYGGVSVDGVFGAMIDSRQVRKLPVQWLLLLLIVYLLVIGPVDQYCLKKAGKQMLTWLTFPIYVVFFSLLIYYIGYKLRAGETEWNELHVVDILPQGEQAVWRGRTYASVYSPVNARYKLAGQQTHATLRGEFMGVSSGGQEASRAEVLQRDKGFEAEIYVPVWTSQLYVSDWAENGDAPLAAGIVSQGTNLQVAIRNNLGREMKDVRLVLRDRIYEIGPVLAGQTSRYVIEATKGTLLRDFIAQNTSPFQTAVQQRQYAFGDNVQRWIDLNPRTVGAASFISQVLNYGPQQQRGFISPAGMDLTGLIERGDAVLLAWDPGHSPSTSPLNRFKTVRGQRNTMYRVALPAGQPANF